MEELRIKEILKEKGKGMTMNDLALKLGINRVSLSVSIRRNPQVDTLKKIANALGVELYELFVRKEGREPDVSGYLETNDHIIHKVRSFTDLERLYFMIKSEINNSSRIL